VSVAIVRAHQSGAVIAPEYAVKIARATRDLESRVPS
jgi:hypothetical protein